MSELFPDFSVRRIRTSGADPKFYLYNKIGRWSRGLTYFDPRALAEYERCYRDPATIHATCEDYRAGASIDLVHDQADVESQRKVTCPLLALWGDQGVINRMFAPLSDWQAVATDVRGRALPSGHFLAEERRKRRCKHFANSSQPVSRRE